MRVSRTHGNDASIVAALSLTPGRISRANARVGGNARLSEASVALAFLSVAREQADRGAEVVLLAREGAHRGVEVRDQVLEQALVADQRAGRLRRAREQARDVARRLGAEQALVDLRRRRAARSARTCRSRSRTAPRSRRAWTGRRPRPRPPSASSSAPSPSASSRSRRSWRVSLWSEVRTWSSWTGAAVRVTLSVSPFPSLGEPAEPAREVDEEVALEEDARADLGGRVLVERQAVLVDLHHHERLVGALLRLDRLDLADLDAGDPHGRVDAQALEDSNTALRRKPWVKGMSLVKPGARHARQPSDDRERRSARRSSPVPARAAAVPARRARAGPARPRLRPVPSEAVLSPAACRARCRSPCGRPATARCPPRTPSSGPATPVFGYGSECR